TSRSHGYSTASNAVSVTTSNDCTWTAVADSGWITITSGAAGTNNGQVAYEVAANPNTHSRTGTIAVADQVLTLVQDALPCFYKLSATTRSHGYSMASNAVSVTTSNDCSWTAVADSGWVTITSGAAGTN